MLSKLQQSGQFRANCNYIYPYVQTTHSLTKVHNNVHISRYWQLPRKSAELNESHRDINICLCMQAQNVGLSTIQGGGYISVHEHCY